jgi:hypothetical protein
VRPLRAHRRGGFSFSWKSLAVAWFAAHLLCETLFALCPHPAGFWHYLPLWSLTPVRLYGAFTGATGSYGFFSPDITPQLRARFVLRTAQGEVEVPLYPPMNHEAELRVGDLVDAQWEFRTDPKSNEKNRALAASYAGKVLDRHPEARAVTVLVEYYPLPRLADGLQPLPEWQLFYRASFERTSPQ